MPSSVFFFARKAIPSSLVPAIVAPIEETKINRKVTGTAVGLISVIGFTPEIYFASIAGRLLDAAPGIAGHQHVFLMLAGFAVTGILATVLLAKIKTKIKGL